MACDIQKKDIENLDIDSPFADELLYTLDKCIEESNLNDYSTLAVLIALSKTILVHLDEHTQYLIKQSMLDVLDIDR